MNHSNSAVCPKSTDSMPLTMHAIPISMDLKRYYWMKYRRLRRENGVLFAAKVFSDLSDVLMQYIADISRQQNRESWISKAPVRKNGWLRQLFDYADSDPLSVLQFIRIYTTETSPAVTVEDAVESQHVVLGEAEPGKPLTCLQETVEFIKLPKRKTIDLLIKLASRADSYDNYQDFRKDCVEYSHLPVTIVSAFWHNRVDADEEMIISELSRYTGRYSHGSLVAASRLWTWKGAWRNLLARSFTTNKVRRIQDNSVETVLCSIPRPENYARVTTIMHPIHQEMHYCYASPEELDWCRYLSFVVSHPHDYIIVNDMAKTANCSPAEAVRLFVRKIPAGLPETPYSGEIHYIPKKGSYKRRPIAAPNRFCQAESLPFRDFLRLLTRNLPNNCQFDQSKMDKQIRYHLQRGDASCADLSQATDWMPVVWFEQIWNALLEDYTRIPSVNADVQQAGKTALENIRRGSTSLADAIALAKAQSDSHNSKKDVGRRRSPKSHVILESKAIYDDMRKGLWLSESSSVAYDERWLRGQPLGAYPSFEILTLTHYFLLEAISLFLGRLDSPYAVLGDDVVFFDRRLRQSYIRLMQKVGSPISLHKSFDGRMVEFAGKLFIKNQPTAFRPALKYVGWSNLLDWQSSAGKPIPFEDLPQSVKERLEKEVNCAPGYNVKGHNVVQALYEAMQIVSGARSFHTIGSKPMVEELVSNYYSYWMYEEEPVDLNKSPLIIPVAGTTVSFNVDTVRAPRNPSLRNQSWAQGKYFLEQTTSVVRKCLTTQPHGRVRDDLTSHLSLTNE